MPKIGRGKALSNAIRRSIAPVYTALEELDRIEKETEALKERLPLLERYDELLAEVKELRRHKSQLDRLLALPKQGDELREKILEVQDDLARTEERYYAVDNELFHAQQRIIKLEKQLGIYKEPNPDW